MKRFYTLLLVSFVAINPFTKFRNTGYIPLFPSGPVAFCGNLRFALPDSLQPPAKLLSGMGNLNHPISTKSELSQKFFNQGLSLIYGFNHNEAIRSFKQAISNDSTCAMAYWGIAYAWGPNINMPMTEANEKTAYQAIQKAKSLVPTVSKKDAEFINALSLRYSDGKKGSRKDLDSLYIRAMKNLASNYPDDADAQTLYADALMNTFPWQYWEASGKLKPKAEEVYQVLTLALKDNPDHVGANHLMIHLVEGSNDLTAGLQSARVLASLMPGAGHIVHMPSHIYIRTGMFVEAEKSNVDAVKIDEAMYGNMPDGMYSMYYSHNIHFLTFTANMLGQSNASLNNATKIAGKIDKRQLGENVFMQEMSLVPMYSMVRFGKWNQVLEQPDPGNEYPYMQAIWHFARGMANTRQGKFSAAATDLKKLDSLRKLDTLKSMYASLDPVSNTVTVATLVLKGQLSYAKGDVNEGIKTLMEGVKSEDQLIYNEPPTWPLPVREYLGVALLKTKNYAAAEKVFREDLKRHPDNGWSLLGLQQSLTGQQKTSESQQLKKQFENAWRNADVKIQAAVF
ncbi:hypothetical protein GS399_10175 [Pedobacter sp. HMF7647]|uniref:Tetratricopeptide repeat protein n=1 Tax=Hufsiella arboris TaxID=2695275 RepID=A0A7K1Y9S5_9SPHI|nr:hypothetical protein [Hufsiella arboris]MXV51335.1 hypothetical protein [Hufsiella arboris]